VRYRLADSGNRPGGIACLGTVRPSTRDSVPGQPRSTTSDRP
jgi:hypothetical protein